MPLSVCAKKIEAALREASRVGVRIAFDVKHIKELITVEKTSDALSAG